MAGGPCAKIFMTVKRSLLSRQLMAPDDVPMFYLFFIYLFTSPPPALSFVSTRKETTLSLTQPNCGHLRQAYLSERIERSSLFFLPSFLSSLPSQPSTLSIYSKRDRAWRGNVVKVNRSHAYITPERLYTREGGWRLNYAPCK